MRLDNQQITALTAALKHMKNEDEAFLFGSRVDDNKSGGDIDILVFSAQPSFELSQKISREFFKRCEEKIDVLVINPNVITPEQSLFVNSIQKVPLKFL